MFDKEDAGLFQKPKPKKKAFITGTLKEAGQSLLSNAGKKYFKFTLITPTSKVYTCLVFNEKAELAEKKLSKANIPLSVFGTYKDEEAESSLCLWVSSWNVLSEPLNHREQLVKSYGSISEAKRVLEEFHASRTEKGYVLCREMLNGEPVYHWAKKEDAIEIEIGVWQTKIDFLMDVLGPSAVCAELRKLTSTENIERGKIGNFSRASYVALIDSLIERAKPQRFSAEVTQELAEEAWLSEASSN